MTDQGLAMAADLPELSDDAFRAASIRLDELVRDFETLPYPAIREQIFELLAAVDTIHRIGLHRLATMLNDQRQTGSLERVAQADFAVKTLLTLYDLLPAAQGAGSATPAMTPPGVATDAVPNFIPLNQIKRAPVDRPTGSHDVARLDDVPPGTMHEIEMDGARVLLANVGGTIYAVPNSCPGSMAPLSLGSFSPPVIICPWHNDAFDIRTGQRVDGATGPPLTLLPVEVEGDVIKLGAVKSNALHVPRGPLR